LGDLLGLWPYSRGFLNTSEEIGHGEVPIRKCPLLKGLPNILKGVMVGKAVFSSYELGFLFAYRTSHGQEGSAREIKEKQFF